MSEAEAGRSPATTAADEESLAGNFLRYFAVEVANTPELATEAYQLRYSVYCEEFHYEDEAAFPEQTESDDFDGHSINCLIRHRPSGLAAGCIRVVNAGDGLDLPLEKYCIESIHPKFREFLAGERGDICEFSRLAVNRTFRRRPKESMSRIGRDPNEELSRDEERTFPLIAVAAFLSSFAIADLTERGSVFAMMEPFLPRMLKRSGIAPESAGSEIDYHGQRAAYFITTQNAVGSLNPELSQLYDALKQEIQRQGIGSLPAGKAD